MLIYGFTLSVVGYVMKFGDYEQGLKYLLEAEKLGRDDEWLNTEIWTMFRKT